MRLDLKNSVGSKAAVTVEASHLESPTVATPVPPNPLPADLHVTDFPPTKSSDSTIQAPCARFSAIAILAAAPTPHLSTKSCTCPNAALKSPLARTSYKITPAAKHIL